MQYAGTTVPTGWLLCDGSVISRTTYAFLYNAIGTTYGQGDGSTTFALPNLADKFVLGKGTTHTTLAATGGEATHILTTTEMPRHNHNASSDTQGAHSHTLTWQGTTDRDPNYDTFVAGTAAGESAHTTAASISTEGAHSHNITVNNAGGNAAHNNMPPYIVMNYIIKY